MSSEKTPLLVAESSLSEDPQGPSQERESEELKDTTGSGQTTQKQKPTKLVRLGGATHIPPVPLTTTHPPLVDLGTPAQTKAHSSKSYLLTAHPSHVAAPKSTPKTTRRRSALRKPSNASCSKPGGSMSYGSIPKPMGMRARPKKFVAEKTHVIAVSIVSLGCLALILLGYYVYLPAYRVKFAVLQSLQGE